MSALESDITEKVLQWISYGDDDLLYERHGFTLTSEAPYRLTAYHAQQCAEKYIKAYLVFLKIDFPFTHNIAHLLELFPKSERTDSLLDAEELSTYAVSARYPGEDEPVTEPEAKRAIYIAETVREVLRSYLIARGMALNE